MTYRIARNGQTYGPYSLLEVERHIASGHIVATDLGQGTGQQEWLPIAELFPTAAATELHPGGVPQLFPDPPDLHWAWLLLLSIVTLGVFASLWDVYEAYWLRRIDRASNALWLYLASSVLFFIKLPTTWHNILYNLGFGDQVSNTSWSLTLLAVAIALSARFVFRAELLRHFNQREPIGLRLGWFMTLVFGGLYFQYHFNQINRMKRSLRISVPSL